MKQALPVLKSKLSTKLRHNESVRYSTESTDMSGMKRQHRAIYAKEGLDNWEHIISWEWEGATIIYLKKTKKN